MRVLSWLGDWISANPDTAVNLLVAIGTIGLVVFVVLESRSGLARELAHEVYAPLASEASGWLEADQCASAGIASWKKIKRERPYLAHRIPKKLFRLLERVEDIVDELHSLLGRMSNRVEAAARNIATSFLQRTGSGSAGAVAVRLVGESGVEPVDLRMLWITGRSLEVTRRETSIERMDPELKAEILVGAKSFTDSRDLDALTQKVFDELNNDPVAQRVRVLANQLADVGPAAEKLIRRRLRQRTAYWANPVG